MAAISNYLENALINATLRNTGYSSPATVYVSLFTTDPTDDGSGTEVSGGSYARVAATFGAPSNGSSSITADVTFSQATANWGVVTHFGIHDALTGGNLLYHGQLTASKNVETGDLFKIPTGQLTVTLA
jgi:hypothetical protein